MTYMLAVRILNRFYRVTLRSNFPPEEPAERKLTHLSTILILFSSRKFGLSLANCNNSHIINNKPFESWKLVGMREWVMVPPSIIKLSMEGTTTPYYIYTSMSQNSRKIQFYRLIEVFDLLRVSSYHGFRKKIRLKEFLKCFLFF